MSESGSEDEKDDAGPAEGETDPAKSGADQEEAEAPPQKPDERLDELELRLIAQEHRIFTIVGDILKHEARSNKRRRAILALVAWFVFRNPIVSGAGIVAIAGVWFAYVSAEHFEAQNELVKKQNELVTTQNELAGKQTEYFQRQLEQEAVQDFRARRAHLLSTIYDRRNCWASERPRGEEPTPNKVSKKNEPGCPVASIEARAAAAVTLVQIEREVRESPGAWPGVVVSQGTDLTGADLAGAALSFADLSGTNLHGANLSNAVLSFSVVSEANLISANLSGTYLMGADLSRANLDGADLSEANLSEANLSEANLSEANLSNANLSNANLSNCRYCPADTEKATRWPDDYTPEGIPVPPELCRRGFALYE